MAEATTESTIITKTYTLDSFRHYRETEGGLRRLENKTYGYNLKPDTRNTQENDADAEQHTHADPGFVESVILGFYAGRGTQGDRRHE